MFICSSSFEFGGVFFKFALYFRFRKRYWKQVRQNKLCLNNNMSYKSVTHVLFDMDGLLLGKWDAFLFLFWLYWACAVLSTQVNSFIQTWELHLLVTLFIYLPTIKHFYIIVKFSVAGCPHSPVSFIANLTFGWFHWNMDMNMSCI